MGGRALAVGTRRWASAFPLLSSYRLWATHLRRPGLGGHRFGQLASSATLAPMPRNWKTVAILLLGTVTAAAWTAVILQRTLL